MHLLSFPTIAARPPSDSRNPTVRSLLHAGRLLLTTILAATFFGVVAACGGTSQSEIAHVPGIDMAQIDETLARNPSDDALRARLAAAYADTGDYARAIEMIDQALAINANNEEALILGGALAAENSDFESAVRHFSRVVEINLDNPLRHANMRLQAVHYELGVALAELNRPEEAIEQFDESLSIAPTDADALYRLGLAEAAVGKRDAAVQTIKRAIELVPDFEEAYAALADLYADAGDGPRAEWAIALVKVSRGDNQAAISDLRALIRDLPESAGVFLGLGMAYENVGRPDLATAAYHNTIQLDPSNWLARQRLDALTTNSSSP